MKPVCVPCERFMRPKKNGYLFVEGMEVAGAPRPVRRGKAEPEKWTGYKLWMGDLWECPDCGTEAIIGTGREPISEHYQEDFQKKAAGATLLVKDC